MTDALHAVPELEPVASIEVRLVEILRTLIVRGELAQGERLVHRQLASRLGVSPTPVKVALSKLEEQGFVATDVSGGSSVTWLTRERLEEVYTQRAAMEGLIASYGAPLVKPATIDKMRACLVNLRSHAQREAHDDYLAERWTFHTHCYEHANRPRLLAHVAALYQSADRFNRLLLSSPERFARSQRFYADFLAACQAHDGNTAAAAITASTDWCLETLGDQLPSDAEVEQTGGSAPVP
ncbi:MAG: GntR family transcriptional regulator [Nitriliruptoraceae bacterium]